MLAISVSDALNVVCHNGDLFTLTIERLYEYVNGA